MRFNMLFLRVNHFAPIAQSHFLAEMTDPRHGQDGVDPEVFGQTNVQGASYRYVTYTLFNTISKSTGYSSQYVSEPKLSALANFDVRTLFQCFVHWPITNLSE